MKIGKTFEFHAAHYLPKHPGKCKEVHGHTYKLEVVLSAAEVDENTGMILDFADIEAEVTPLLERYFDHQFLNDFFENPTCENICQFIYDKLSAQFKGDPVFIWKVRLWETSSSYAEVGLG